MKPEWAAVWMAGGSLLVAVLALVGTAFALAYSKGQRDATERQATAAEAQVEFMRRQVEVMERQAAAHPKPELADQVGITDAMHAELIRGAPYVSPWSVRPTGSRNAFTLVNGSAEPAFDVNISFDVQPPRVEPTAWGRIDPRASVRVSMFRAMGASPDAVTVRWRRTPDGEQLDWTTSLP